MVLYIAGKKLVVCHSAVDSLSSIVETVGGDKEKARARYCYIHTH